jgi:hypothetical protein
MTTTNPRLYTGEFPPNRPDMTVDELVSEMVLAVERVRIKYGMAVEDIAARQGADVEDVLSWLDRRYDVEADTRRAVAEERVR